jgi:hypothetical protein
VYDITMYVLCALLALGFLCNLLVRPVNEKHFMTDAELKAETRLSREETPATGTAGDTGLAVAGTGNRLKLRVAWLAVGVPSAWGVWTTLSKAIALFR